MKNYDKKLNEPKGFSFLLFWVFLFVFYQISFTQVYIKDFSDFPAYPYNTQGYMQGGVYVGCGPTTGAMIFGYFHHIENMPNSSGLLLNPGSGVNEGLNTAWSLHSSIYMNTGSNGFGSVYDIEPGLESYAEVRGYKVKVMIHASPTYDPNSSSSDWLNAYGSYGESWANDGYFWRTDGTNWSIDANDFCDFVQDKLSNGITIFLTIDTNEDREGDHWVPLVGYNRTSLKYAYYDTYDSNIHWADIHYCNASGPTKDNSIAFLRSVTYEGSTQQPVRPPQNLVVLSGYHLAIPLAWNSPVSSQQANQSIQKYTEFHGENIQLEDYVVANQSNQMENKVEKHGDISKSGASYFVNIAATNALGYNVYRSTSSTGSFTKIASQIKQLYYRDESVSNGQKYYYRVTAVYNEGESAPTSITSGAAVSNGYMVQSGWANAVPNLNGVINSSEWSTAAKSNVVFPGKSGTVTLMVMNNNNQLYIAIDNLKDTKSSDYDGIGVFCDDNCDRSWPSSTPSGEGLIQQYQQGGSPVNQYQGFYGIWPDQYKGDSWLTPSGVKQTISFNSGHMQLEASFDLNTSPYNASPGDLIGMLFYILDATDGEFDGLWPQATYQMEPITENYTWAHGPFSYGTIKLSKTTAKPDIVVEPGEWNFGSVTVGSFVAQTFVIQNKGNADLKVSTVGLSGRDFGHYVYQSGGIGIVKPGDTKDLVIRFSPSSSGQKLATLAINSDDPDENQVQINLSGTGVKVPQLSADKNELKFGTAIDRLEFKITNAGGGTLNWTITNTMAKTWITSITPNSGTNNATVAVSVDRSKLSADRDEGYIHIESNGGNHDVDVSLAKPVVEVPDHWKFADNTSNNAIVVLPVSAKPNVNNTPLLTGDCIGVFTEAGVCCGYEAWNNENISITVWGDDDQTQAVDGFKSGETIHYRIYRSSDQKEWNNISVGYSQGTGKYSVDAYMVIDKLETLDEVPEHWNYSDNTSTNATVVLPTSAKPNINGIPLLNGDRIGVFTEAGLCCGYDVWNNENLAIIVWGDDDQTQAVDGFKSGDAIHYRIYHPSEQKEWSNVSAGYSQGSGKYSANAFLVLNRLEVLNKKTITLNFSQGWNMFSYNVAVQDARPETVFSSIVEKVKIVKNGMGDPYIPEHSIDKIEQMSYKEGYLGYFLDETKLEISGQAVDPQTPIELQAGWNMIGFLPDNPINTKEALASVADHLVIAKDGKGQSYIPEFSINQIGELKPGCGYLVYLEEKGILIYPSVPTGNSTLAMAKTSAKNGLLEHFQFSGNTGENATVVVPLDSDPSYPDGSLLESGDEIGVFTSKGVCCGASIWEEANTAITVWGNDPQTEAVDGCKAGDTLYYRLWEKSTDKEYCATAVYKNNDPVIYKANGFSVIEDLFATITDIGAFSETMPQVFRLQQNYPNPFNPSTKISFSLTGSSDITLTVYNLNGQKIRTLIHQQLPSGHHSAQWDARDNLGTPVSSGIYFYRLTVQQGSKRLIEVKKMTLMR